MVTAVKRDGKVGLAYMKSFEIEERIRREGIAEGLAEGKAAGIAESILDILSDVGDIPLSLREQITAQKDEAVLRAWLKLAAKAESIEAFEERIMKE